LRGYGAYDYVHYVHHSGRGYCDAAVVDYYVESDDFNFFFLVYFEDFVHDSCPLYSYEYSCAVYDSSVYLYDHCCAGQTFALSDSWPFVLSGTGSGILGASSLSQWAGILAAVSRLSCAA